MFWYERSHIYFSLKISKRNGSDHLTRHLISGVMLTRLIDRLIAANPPLSRVYLQILNTNYFIREEVSISLRFLLRLNDTIGKFENIFSQLSSFSIVWQYLIFLCVKVYEFPGYTWLQRQAECSFSLYFSQLWESSLFSNFQ